MNGLSSYSHHPFWRRVRANWRDTLLLFKQFWRPLFFFIAIIIGGGYLFYYLAEKAGESVVHPTRAIYHILGLIFLQPIEEFPNTWYLQIFNFIMPLIGIGILAQGVANFGVLLFNRRARGQEWEMAVASTYSNHVILVGLGHLGYRVTGHLHEMGQDVVVIELNPVADLVQSVRDLGIPVLVDDGTREVILDAAGVKRARSIMLCTQNDSLNLQMAVKARGMNPDIEVVVRIFDNDFARALQEQFNFKAFSSTGMAAPVFAAAGAGVDMTRPITVEGQALSLAQLTVESNSKLIGMVTAEVEGGYDVSVVLLRHAEEPPDFHPAPDRVISAGDALAILGCATEISKLAQDNHFG
jgi:voltage-gated potassium channel